MLSLRVVLPNHDRTASLTLGEFREFNSPPLRRPDFRCCAVDARDCCCSGERLAGGGPSAGPTMNVHNVIAATQRNCIVCTSKPSHPPRENAVRNPSIEPAWPRLKSSQAREASLPNTQPAHTCLTLRKSSVRFSYKHVRRQGACRRGVNRGVRWNTKRTEGLGQFAGPRAAGACAWSVNFR
jgi:hypothetical protein